jgi:hypothetical protein
MLREADQGMEQQHLFLLGVHPSSKASDSVFREAGCSVQ